MRINEEAYKTAVRVLTSFLSIATLSGIKLTLARMALSSLSRQDSGFRRPESCDGSKKTGEREQTYE